MSTMKGFIISLIWTITQYGRSRSHEPHRGSGSGDWSTQAHQKPLLQSFQEFRSVPLSEYCRTIGMLTSRPKTLQQPPHNNVALMLFMLEAPNPKL